MVDVYQAHIMGQVTSLFFSLNIPFELYMKCTNKLISLY